MSNDASQVTDCVCVLLGSGLGTRMGGPKALLLWQGDVPLAVAHARVRREQGIPAVLVCREPVAQALALYDSELRVIVSHEPDELGPAGSLGAAAAQHVWRGYSRVLVTPVDVPPVRGTTALHLLAGLQNDIQAVRPRFLGRGGHPVACCPDLLSRAYGAEFRPPLRDVLRALGPQCLDLNVDDVDVVANLDTPEAYLARTGRLPRFGT